MSTTLTFVLTIKFCTFSSLLRLYRGITKSESVLPNKLTLLTLPRGRWTRQRVGQEVSGCSATDWRPDVVLHSVQVIPAEKPAAERKPQLQPWWPHTPWTLTVIIWSTISFTDTLFVSWYVDRWLIIIIGFKMSVDNITINLFNIIISQRKLTENQPEMPKKKGFLCYPMLCKV